MCSGLLDRYPNLRVGFLESGSRWVDFLAKRIGENSGLVESRTSGNLRSRSAPVDEASIGGSGLFRPGGYNAELLPEEYIKRGQIFVNCEIDENQLPFIIKEYGEDFLIFASDIPHGHRLVDPVGKLTARTDITEVAKRKIAIDNVARFYGLPVPVLEPAATAAG
jgi:predicted TIM-barrel fold metal-dependent hydrolase